MNKTTNGYISIYKAQLEKGDIQIAYERLLKYVMALKAYFERKWSHESPDFSDTDALSEQIVQAAMRAIERIMPFLQGD